MGRVRKKMLGDIWVTIGPILNISQVWQCIDVTTSCIINLLYAIHVLFMYSLHYKFEDVGGVVSVV